MTERMNEKGRTSDRDAAAQQLAIGHSSDRGRAEAPTQPVGLADGSCRGSARKAQGQKDEGQKPLISEEKLERMIKKVGKPWHRRKKEIPLRMINGMKELGFSLRQIGKWYGVSETTIRRRLRGR